MKQITYELQGHVSSDMTPAITASCDSLRGVVEATITIRDEGERDTLTLCIEGETEDTLDRDVRAILEAKGLSLVSDSVVTGTGSAPKPVEEPRHYVLQDAQPTKQRSVPLTAAIASVVTAVILTVLLTFALTTAYHRNETPPPLDTDASGQTTAPYAELDVIDRLFRSLTMMDLDDQALLDAVLKGYVSATGDPYAAYYTAEEFAEQTSSMNGEMSGIGVSITPGEIVSNGATFTAIIVAYVYPDSPAEKAGVVHGDAIMFVGSGDDKTLVNEIGYEKAIERLTGKAGTECSFTVYRRPQGSAEDVPYEEIDITAIRHAFTAKSVLYRVYEADSTVGIVRITGFDNPTPAQFVEAMDALQAQGCTSFVIDLRYNPGGALNSVEDILTYFLSEGDTIISTKNSAGDTFVTKLEVNESGKVTCGSGTIDRSDIGKYASLPLVVLVNENSASASELFTANIRDHELGTIVGVKTYGKGSMQTTYSLARYGYDGALKLTTAYYYPPCGESYDGIGITPDITVALSEEALTYNFNLLPDELDNQLITAVEALTK